MLGRKKEVVLTRMCCRRLEALRLALEVFTGQRISFRQMDLNTNKGQVYVGKEMKDIVFNSFQEDTLFSFSFLENGRPGNYYLAKFDTDSGTVRAWNGDAEVVCVWNESNIEKTQIVGKSATERWEEPLTVTRV